jgi:hypothetical protein
MTPVACNTSMSSQIHRHRKQNGFLIGVSLRFCKRKVLEMDGGDWLLTPLNYTFFGGTGI